MIVPSIDILAGRAVQLEGGDPDKLRVDGGDPRDRLDTYGLIHETAVIDLDAALGRGDNTAIIDELAARAPVRVGGGIRSVDAAIARLDAGAAKVILGTAATPDVLRELPRERVIAALDARDGEVVTHGWTQGTGASVLSRIDALRAHAGGFLVTFVEVEGSMKGLPIERAAELKAHIGDDCTLTVAGGVRSTEEIAELDRLGIDVQVGMALYTGAISLTDAFTACLRTDRDDGLWPTVVCDEHGAALGLVYSNAESVAAAIDEQRGVYHSRSRGGLWRKGETSGATQELLRIDADCDRDALRFTVRQRTDSGQAGFCHTGTRTCWGDGLHGVGLPALARKLADPATRAAPGSYTARLFTEDGLMEAKLREEAAELNEARAQHDIVHEAADVIFFTLARAARDGASLEDIERELARRAKKVTRRRGDAKPGRGE